MTGAYLRVKRDGTWQNVEVENLTKEERFDMFERRPVDELLRWMDMLCATIASIEKVQYPDGKISDDDKGAFGVAVTPDHEHKLVRMIFSDEVTWLALPADQARAWAKVLIATADELEGR